MADIAQMIVHRVRQQVHYRRLTITHQYQTPAAMRR